MAKKKKIYKVGIDSETYAISLVESPAIEETLVALEEQKPIKVQLADEEKHMVYSAVLVPEKPIYRRNEDGDEFYIEFTKESIEKMSQDFMKNYRQNEITLDHETMANDITLVESWLKTDMYKDKSVAIGLSEDLPIGTWIAGLKVNQIDVWERIKSGELKGFSVESMISLEDFNKQNNMEIETNEMFWDKLKNILKEAFGKKDEKEIEDGGEYTVDEIVNMEEETPNEPPTEPTETIKSDEQTVEPTEVKEEPTEHQDEPTEKQADVNQDVTRLEELIKNLNAEIESLKNMNGDLNTKVKELSKEPSAKPLNPNSKPSESNTYSQWREQMRNMIG